MFRQGQHPDTHSTSVLSTSNPSAYGEPFNVLRYENGQHYHSHLDAFPEKDYGPQSSQRVSGVLTWPCCSFWGIAGPGELLCRRPVVGKEGGKGHVCCCRHRRVLGGMACTCVKGSSSSTVPYDGVPCLPLKWSGWERVPLISTRLCPGPPCTDCHHAALPDGRGGGG